MSTDTLRSLIEADLPEIIKIRHDLHRHPELSFQEHRTAGVVAKTLAEAGVRVKQGLAGGTGVLGYLPASTPEGDAKGAVALRADMDALPVLEETGKAYASCTPGVMHACGHDGHTAILLGAARALAKSHRPRPVTFVFQPAEEGGGGADIMCREGALAGGEHGGLGNPVESIFGLHGWPTFEVGRVATKPGPILAATDDYIVTVKGRQAHGAYPHYGADPILATAHIVTALQSIASRSVGPLDSVVCSLGAISGGTANNIIPQEVKFIGTIRSLLPATRALAKERFFAITHSTARALGCEAQIEWHEGYPVTANSPEATERFFAVATRVLGPERVERVEQPTMGGEDFSYYGHHVPACFYFLGLRPRNAPSFPTLHQPDFDFNDDALGVGIELMCELASGR
jgi:amidohydrolase